MSDDVAGVRAAIRQRAIAAREAVAQAQRVVWERAIYCYLDDLVGQIAPAALAFCWPFRGEVDLRGWVEAWLAADALRVALLPVVAQKGGALVFRHWQPGMELALDMYGIPFPEEGPEILPDVVLVPLNAFDARGFRLGYGGGYFDRTLAHLKPVTVGVGFELGRETDVLPQAHDVALDWLVTEGGVFSPTLSLPDCAPCAWPRRAHDRP